MQPLNAEKTYLITGGAGFIGFFLSKALLKKGARVIGFDNMNDYYEVSLKEDRLAILKKEEGYTFIKGDLADKEGLQALFQQYRPEIVVNLGAQAGVRYSIDHPDTYMESNIMGFFQLLEVCRAFPVEHLVYASSSSVYGANDKIPFSTKDQVDQPVSLYAATKNPMSCWHMPIVSYTIFPQQDCVSLLYMGHLAGRIWLILSLQGRLWRISPFRFTTMARCTETLPILTIL